MATFELDGSVLNRSARSIGERFEHSGDHGHSSHECAAGDSMGTEYGMPPVKQESIIALKIYDSCRQQDCLNEDDLGPARSACNQTLAGITYSDGEIIEPPDSAASVSVERLRIRKIMILDKRPNQFKRGFWDIDVKYVFEYCLIFREANGCEIGGVVANSIYNRNVTLFGSIGSDIVIASDLLAENNEESPGFSMDPFVLVEAKPISLTAKLKYSRRMNNAERDTTPNEVIVTIGLFSIIRLYRIVTLQVESRGFDIPKPCHEYPPVNVCEYFDNMPFPMDVFAPPQRREFEAGISGDIPRPCDDTRDCGRDRDCDCD